LAEIAKAGSVNLIRLIPA